jgi:hypothetical protein
VRLLYGLSLLSFLISVLSFHLCRRERNRLHAKKTRDRKKYFLEISDKILYELSLETDKLRSYLRSFNIISEEELKKSELLTLKLKQPPKSRTKVSWMIAYLHSLVDHIFVSLLHRVPKQMQQEKKVMKKMMKPMMMIMVRKNTTIREKKEKK